VHSVKKVQFGRLFQIGPASDFRDYEKIIETLKFEKYEFYEKFFNLKVCSIL